MSEPRKIVVRLNYVLPKQVNFKLWFMKLVYFHKTLVKVSHYLGFGHNTKLWLTENEVKADLLADRLKQERGESP